jgi:hypothetical protein
LKTNQNSASHDLRPQPRTTSPSTLMLLLFAEITARLEANTYPLKNNLLYTLLIKIIMMDWGNIIQ